MSLEELLQLLKIGVVVENHGWTHADIRGLNEHQFRHHIGRAVAWLADTLGVRSSQYAVPYGATFVKEEERDLVPGPIFLARTDLPEGAAPHRHWNRRDITAELQAIL
jgi:peptidoglycan/xylan/chitin deacetylase (PgdA/CDA1 family)